MKGSEVQKCKDNKQWNVGECNIFISTATDCSDTNQSPYYVGTQSPYNQITYNPGMALFSENHAVYGTQLGVNTGYSNTQLNGHTVVVTDSEGKNAACGVTKKSDLSKLPHLDPNLGSTTCFAGDALASVEGTGAVRLADLSVGDSVLVRRADGEFAFERLLGFLHATKGLSRFLMVEYAGGELRASANHLVFVEGSAPKLASELQAGDRVLAFNGRSEEARMVLSVRTASSEAGMVAPLTMSGSIVVDGVVASAYATHSPSAFVPHCVLHALFFPARMLASMAVGAWSTGPSPRDNTADALHPLASLYAQALIPFAKATLAL